MFFYKNNIYKMSVKDYPLQNMITTDSDFNPQLVKCKVFIDCDTGRKLREQIVRSIRAKAGKYNNHIIDTFGKYNEALNNMTNTLNNNKKELKDIEENDLSKLLNYKGVINKNTKNTLIELAKLIKESESTSKEVKNYEKEYNKDNLEIIPIMDDILCYVHIGLLNIVVENNELDKLKELNKNNMRKEINGYEGEKYSANLIGEKSKSNSIIFKVDALVKGYITSVVVDTSGILGIGKGKKKITVEFRMPVYKSVTKKENNVKKEYYVGSFETKTVEIEFDNLCIVDDPLISTTAKFSPFSSHNCDMGNYKINSQLQQSQSQQNSEQTPLLQDQEGGRIKSSHKLRNNNMRSDNSTKSSDPSDYSICE